MVPTTSVLTWVKDPAARMAQEHAATIPVAVGDDGAYRAEALDQ